MKHADPSASGGSVFLFVLTKNRREFRNQVQVLRAPDYEDRELAIMPCSVFGHFYPWRLHELVAFVDEYPEYHIVTCIDPHLFINGFVRHAMTYLLADGNRDSRIVYDRDRQLDAVFLYDLNSGRKSSKP